MSFEEIVTKYSPAIISMTLIVMILVGIIKVFTKMIAKKKNAESKLAKVMSYLYVVFAMFVAAGVICAYHGIFKLEFNFGVMAQEWALVYGCTQVLYPIYRDFGGRFLLMKVLTLFKGKNQKTDDMIKVIESVMVLTSAQKEKLTKEIKDNIE